MASPARGLLEELDMLPKAWPYPQRVAIWWGFVLVSGMMIYSQRDIPVGLSRMRVALMVTVLNFILPFFFDHDADLNTNVACFVVTSALSSFKALGWALNRGPLVRPLNFIQFLAIYMWPITPREELGAVSGERAEAAAAAAKKDDDGGAAVPAAKGSSGEGASRRGGRLTESGGTPLQNAAAFCAKAVILVVVCYVLATYNLPRLVKTELLNVSLWASLSMGMDAPAALVGSLLGMEISPHFDNPFISKSMGELWNKRWNLTVGNALRFLIYDPIMEGRMVKDPRAPARAFSPLRRLAGVLSVFFVSGVMHEVLFWYFQRDFLGTWVFYFTLWGVLVSAEAVVRHSLKRRRIIIPPWLGWLYTNAILTVMVDRLWWGPLLRIRMPEKAAAHLLEGLEPVRRYLGI